MMNRPAIAPPPLHSLPQQRLSDEELKSEAKHMLLAIAKHCARQSGRGPREAIRALATMAEIIARDEDRDAGMPTAAGGMVASLSRDALERIAIECRQQLARLPAGAQVAIEAEADD